MKQGAQQMAVPASREEARGEAERVKEAVRGALRTVKSTVRLKGPVSEMVRDFVRGQQASSETALACVGVVVPQLSVEMQMAFLQDVLLRITMAPLHVLAGSVAHSWEQETDTQCDADKAQQRALHSGNPFDEETAERLTLAHAFTATTLALRFRASRQHKLTRPNGPVLSMVRS